MPMPFGALGAAILAHLGAPAAITVTRYESGAYSDTTGNWVRGAPVDDSPISVDAHVQPATPKEILQLPENERSREAIAIYTVDKLLTSDKAAGIEADVVTWLGRSYRVLVVEDWTTQAQYAKAIATRVDE